MDAVQLQDVADGLRIWRLPHPQWKVGLDWQQTGGWSCGTAAFNRSGRYLLCAACWTFLSSASSSCTANPYTRARHSKLRSIRHHGQVTSVLQGEIPNRTP